MKIKYGAMIGMLSGALGNIVASRNRYGAYLRSRVVPTKVTSDFTNDVRGRLAYLSQYWASLTEGKKVAWNTWASTNPITDSLGDKRVLQGSAAFVQLNARKMQAGGDLIDVPPVAAAPSVVEGLAVAAAAGAGTASVTWTSGALPAGCCAAIWIAVVDSAGRSYYKNLLKLVHISAAAGTSPQDVAADIVARFGNLIAGQVIHCEVEVWDNLTGLVSGRVYATTTVTA